MRHSVIHTGGNIYNDYIDMDDNSGRVIIVSEGGIRLFANDRDYQLGCDPIAWASSRELEQELDPIQDDSQIADIESTTDYVFIRDTSGATLTVWRQED